MNKKIILLTIVGLLFRILNPTFGSPTLYVVPDEVANYTSALYMLSNKTFISQTSQYTPFGSYIQIPFIVLSYLIGLLIRQFSSLASFEFFLTTHEGYYLFIPRIISGIFGALSIPVIYFLTHELYPRNKRIPFWSAFLFTFSLNHIQLSHLGKPWAPSLFFFLLSLYFTIKSIRVQRKSNLYTLLASIAIIVSFGFLQIAFYAFLLFLLVKFLYFGRPFFSIKNRFIIINILIVGILCVFISRLVEFKPTAEFLFNIDTKKYNNYIEMFVDLVKNNSALFFVKQLLLSETVMFLFTVPAFLYVRSWKKPFLAITLYLIGYFILIALLFWEASRYLLPIIIFLPIYGALTIDWIERKLNKTSFLYLFRFILFVSAFLLPVVWNIRFLQEPTFVQARKWIDKEIPPQVLIASTAVRFSSFVPSYEAISLYQQINPGFYKKLYSYLGPNYYPDNVRNILYLDTLVGNGRQDIDEYVVDKDIEYVVNYYWEPEYSMASQNPNLYQSYKLFSPITNKEDNQSISNLYSTMTNPNAYKLLYLIERPGPYVEIVRVNNLLNFNSY